MGKIIVQNLVAACFLSVLIVGASSFLFSRSEAFFWSFQALSGIILVVAVRPGISLAGKCRLIRLWDVWVPTVVILIATFRKPSEILLNIFRWLCCSIFFAFPSVACRVLRRRVR